MILYEVLLRKQYVSGLSSDEKIAERVSAYKENANIRCGYASCKECPENGEDCQSLTTPQIRRRLLSEIYNDR